MARLNDFMACPELAPISNYCLANGTAATYGKGQSFVDEGSLCRYVAVVRSGYFKFSVIDKNGDECTTGFSFAGDIVADYAAYIASTAKLLLQEAYRRYIDMHRFSPEERYLKLIGRVPGLLSLVPLQELASYLCISRRQFQRIRALAGHLSHGK